MPLPWSNPSCRRAVNNVPDTIPWYNDLPIATPAYGGASNVSAVAQYAMRCWKGTDEQNMRCVVDAVSDTGLCEMHLREMRMTCP